MDACHAGDEGGHANQQETSDGVPNEGDEGDTAPGSKEVLDKGHIDWGEETQDDVEAAQRIRPNTNSENKMEKKSAMTRRRTDHQTKLIWGRDEYASIQRARLALRRAAAAAGCSAKKMGAYLEGKATLVAT